jgi:hypothetical protein
MVHHAAIMAPGMPINTGTGSATIRLDSIGAVTRHSGAIEAAQSTPRDGFGTWVGQAAVARRPSRWRHGFTLFPNQLSEAATARMNAFLNLVLG